MKYIFSLFFILILITICQAQDQKDIHKVKTRYGFEVNRKPAINYNIFVNYTKGGWHPQLYLGVAIQNDALQFEKIENNYHSRYQISVAIRKDDITVLKENWTNDVYVKDFEETNSRSKYQYSYYHLSDVYPFGRKRLAGNEYELLFEIRDLITKKSHNDKRKFILKPSAKKKENQVFSTGIAFLVHPKDSTHSLPLYPGYSTLNYNTQYYAYARIKTSAEDSLQINTRIFKLRKEDEQLFYQKYFTIPSDSNVSEIVFKMPVDSLSEGEYRLRFSSENNNETFSIYKKFSVVWFEKPTYLYKTDLAIRPMKYLLPEEEFKKVKKLNSSELEDWFNEYWKKKDPTPESDFNELLIEYYQRVQESNRKFSTRNKEGWETDRGKILLMYGKPKKIENRRYATTTLPYMVWIYNDELSFVFIDKNNDGEFTLIEDKEKD